MSTFCTRTIHWVALLTGCTLAAGHVAANAQAFPTKPIELVVHTSPGGGTDVFARAVADVITKERLLPQPVTVSNRSGGSGAVAYNYIKSKRGDPHVVLTVASGTFLTAAARPEQGYGLEHFTPLAFMAMDAQAVAVQAESKFATVQDLIEAGKREPNQIAASVASATGTGRLLLFLLERETGAKFKFVPFKSGADAAMSVLGGHVPFTTENLSEMFPQVEAKKMRVLAVTGEKRLAAVPDTPTLKELGYKIVVGTGRGFALPAGVPKEALAVMEGVMQRVHASPLWRDFAARMMYEDTYMSSAEFAQHLQVKRAEMVEFLHAVGLMQQKQ
ncbi:MAG TPA: tripartite tricarboxylate transporter substrate binding protein [Burkholderiales bacterium]|nr:tripartite tricarboxylate transporter substrate binding protein [Burkholderiales bacterium]